MLGSVRERGCGAGRVRSRPSIASQAVPQVESWQLGATLLVPGFACHSGRKLPSVFHLPPLLLAPNQSSRAGFPFPPPPFVPTHWNALWAGRPLKPLSNPEPLETYSSHLSAAGCLPFLSLPRPPPPPASLSPPSSSQVKLYFCELSFLLLRAFQTAARVSSLHAYNTDHTALIVSDFQIYPPYQNEFDTF